ncbi:hypothetical protein LVJ94_33135 [Pendulispora rubella]|uniref:Hint domain-containing protein n=1 Tax=Pendulispora rubella TaxID=2741070 RepID=A0ABZ2KSV8_9BACT
MSVGNIFGQNPRSVPPESRRVRMPAWLVATLFLLLTPLLAGADQAIILSNFAGTGTFGGSVTAGVGAAGRGSASYTFQLPAARGRVQPGLSLSYTSSISNEVREAGANWGFDLPAIERKPIQGGNPTGDQDERVVYNGEPLVFIGEVNSPSMAMLDGTVEPMPSWATGFRYYRLQAGGGRMRFFRSADQGTWIVQNGDGIDLTFTWLGSAWRLTQQNDGHCQPDGGVCNAVIYQWSLSSGGREVLTDIYDTVPLSKDLSKAAHRTHIVYEAHDDKAINWGSRYAQPWQRKPNARVKRIDITANGHNASKNRAVVRRYHLTYESYLHRSLLTSIAEEGACAVTEENPSPPNEAPETNCPRLPATTFEYTRPQPFFGPSLGVYDGETSPPPPGSLFGDLGTVSFADVDHDGSIDVISQPPPGEGGEGRVYFTSNLPLGGNVFIDVANLYSPNSNIFRTSGDLTLLKPLDTTGVVSAYWSRWDDATKRFRVSQARVRDTQGPIRPPRWTMETSAEVGQLPDAIVAAGDFDSNGAVDLFEFTQQIAIDPQTGQQVVVYNGQFRLFNRFTSPQDPNAFPAQNVIKEPFDPTKRTYTTTFRKDVPFYAFADMNGDGTEDFVTVRQQISWMPGVDPNAPSPDTLIYVPGNNTGFFACDKGSDTCTTPNPPCWRASGEPNETCPSPWIELPSAPLFNRSADRPTLLADVTQDGLTDIIQLTPHDGGTDVEADVWVNDDGHRFHHAGKDTAMFRDHVRVAIGDINGNGTPDLIFASRDGRVPGLSFSEHFHIFPGLLTEVHSGAGATTKLTYSSVHSLDGQAAKGRRPWSQHSAAVDYVVTDAVQSQTRPDGTVDSINTHYTYRNPAFDAWEQRLLGFREIEARSDYAATVSKYFFGRCQESIQACDGTSDIDYEKPLSGLPYQVDTKSLGPEYTVSTVLRHYKTVRLYKEPNSERDASFAYADRVDSYLYDTHPFIPAPQTDAVELVDDSRVSKVSVTLAAFQGREHLRVEEDRDVYGNVIARRDHGRIKNDGTAVDPMLEMHTIGMGFAGNPDLYMFGPSSQVTTGFGNRPGLAFDPDRTVAYVYNNQGDVTDIRTNLEGTLPLVRSHETSGAALAPPPPGASSAGTVFIAHFDYDPLGNLVKSHGAAQTSCLVRQYDKDYAQLLDTTTQYISGCSGASLAESIVYDPRFDVPRLMMLPDGTRSQIDYDMFGRVASTTAPDPDVMGMLSQRSASFAYPLPRGNITGVSATFPTSADRSVTSWKYTDAFGQALATISQADPAEGDGAPWVVRRATRYAYGLPVSGFQPYWSQGDPAQLAFNYPSTEPDAHYALDGLGRVLDIADRGRTTFLRHHALSTDYYDSEDVGSGPNKNTPTTVFRDGHGRVSQVREVNTVGDKTDAIFTSYDYNAAGQVLRIRRHHSLGPEEIVRWMQYDSMGRMVLNAEPNTAKNFVPNPQDGAALTSMRAWRYAYDDAGRLVGTSDPRGCGKNRFYDGMGRLLAEDYSPCLAHHELYTKVENGKGFEAVYLYDEPGLLQSPNSLGRMTTVADRGAVTYLSYDGRGRVSETARRITRPASSGPSSSRDFGGLDIEVGLGPIVIVIGGGAGGGGSGGDAGADAGGPQVSGDRYAPHLYRKSTSYDLVNRVIGEDSGADVDELLQNGQSRVSYAYATRGMLKSVSSSYGPLLANVTYNADERLDEAIYGDKSSTHVKTTYDRHDVKSYKIWRAPPAVTEVLADLSFEYDLVGNATKIIDNRAPAAWPDGARPRTQTLTYDGLYRLTSERSEYATASKKDQQVSPFAPEHEDSFSPVMPRLGRTSRSTKFDIAYDFSGNTVSLNDSDATVFDRAALGTITNGDSEGHPNRLTGATVGVEVKYDDAGNVIEMLVPRTGECTTFDEKCSHHFIFNWDEVGQLVRARRWDYKTIPANEPRYPAIPSSFNLNVDVRYAYSQGQRVLKSIQGERAGEKHSVEVFGSLRLDNADWEYDFESHAKDYERTAATESAYLGGMAHVVVTEEDLPSMSGSKRHVFLAMGDRLGSTNVVIDHESGELAESIQYHPYGTVDSDYRPERWGHHRELYQFTGKEADIELGLTYFGARYYNTGIGRWMSADPLTVHQAAGDLNPYAYVNGSPMEGTDSIGLCNDELGCNWRLPPLPIIGGGTGGGGGGSGSGEGNPIGGSGVKSRPGVRAPAPVPGSARGYIDLTMAGGSTKDFEAARDNLRAGIDKHSTVIAGAGILAGLQTLVIAGASELGAFVTSSLSAAGRTWTSAGQWVAARLPWTATAATATTTVASGLNGNPTASTLLNGGCFTAGTLVATCDGSTQPIETIRAGDSVLSWNEATGQAECRDVLRSWVRASNALVDVAVADSDGPNDVIHATADHPFWVEEKGWTAAGDLAVGDHIRVHDGASVVGLREAPRKSASALVYNFAVEANHSYFVGPMHVLVHNSNPCELAVEGVLATEAAATELNAVAGRIAADQRTAAILETREGITLVGGGAVDLTPAQRAFATARGWVPVALPGEDAEITVIQEAARRGLTPLRGATSRDICSGCSAHIEQIGGMVTGDRTFSFPGSL